MKGCLLENSSFCYKEIIAIMIIRVDLFIEMIIPIFYKKSILIRIIL